jgi:putative flippase GtrA
MYKQFFKYALIGLLSLAIDFVVYYLLSRFVPFFHVQLVGAKAISFLVSSVFNFNFNKKWTFEKRNPHNIKEVGKYYSVALGALGINALLMAMFLKVIPDLWAWLLSAGITALCNFILSRYWVFAKETK